MVAVLLLGLSCICSPLVALVLDYNSIKSSAEVQGTRKSSQCITDQDCNASKFCLKHEDDVSFCVTCRGLRRRCKRNAMCCPGTICLNDVCSQTEEVTPTEGRRTDEQNGSDSKGTTQHQIQENSEKGLVKSPSHKGLDTVLQPHWSQDIRDTRSRRKKLPSHFRLCLWALLRSPFLDQNL
ncbi:dickkopf-related protein 4 isoform X2 [Chelonia mydas]|uniref:dickkopf-related protein 4 isoform X2 n=1 Tax=Chelonia mydas TaxID=8469 RepID=UPI000FFC5769|nr:dickkopf-related protein 4 isoform X2 [Chelonia mydas]